MFWWIFQSSSAEKTDKLIRFSILDLLRNLCRMAILFSYFWSFFDIKNRKVTLLPDFLEQIWIIEIKNIFLHSKVQLIILPFKKIRVSVRSFSTGNNVTKNWKFAPLFFNQNYKTWVSWLKSNVILYYF